MQSRDHRAFTTEALQALDSRRNWRSTPSPGTGLVSGVARALGGVSPVAHIGSALRGSGHLPLHAPLTQHLLHVLHADDTLALQLDARSRLEGVAVDDLEGDNQPPLLIGAGQLSRKR